MPDARSTPPRRPNVLLLMTDQQKATAGELYGGPVRTPHLARIASQGMLYERAYTPHPLCVPARVSLWTGRWPHAHGARTNETPMPRAETHLAQLLHGAGYRLGHFGKNHCFTQEDFDACFDRTFFAGHGDRFEPGVTMIRSQLAPPRSESRFATAPAGYSEHWGFRRPTAHTRSEPREESATYRVTEEASRYLEERHQAAPDEPLCLWVSLPDPHEPYQVPEPYASLYPPESISLPPWPPGELEGKPERQRVYHHLLNWQDLSEADARLAMGIYYGMIAFIDERVGTLLDTLERLGMQEDTIVVFCSDHGDFMGEHHMLIKCNAFYDCLTRVPLLLSYPRGIARRGARRPELVSLIDVMPTILRLVGLPVPAAVQGQPLPGTLDSPHGSPRSAPRSATTQDAQDALPPREAIFSEYGAGGPAVTLADARRLSPAAHCDHYTPCCGSGRPRGTARWCAPTAGSTPTTSPARWTSCTTCTPTPGS